jgi:excinuclease UvrABC nuclease subunit
LAQYHQQIRAAWAFLTDPAARGAWRENLQQQMKSAAAQLQFETANRLKQRLIRADALQHEAFAHIMPLDQFAFLALQRGQGKPYVEPWLIRAGAIEPLPQFHRKNLSAAAQDLVTLITPLLAHTAEFRTPNSEPRTLNSSQASAVALVAHHLFSPKPSGIFLPLREFPPDAAQAAAHIAQAAQSLLTKEPAAAPLPEQSSDPDLPASPQPSAPTTTEASS